MKKFYLLFLVATFATVGLNAQFTEGQKVIGGSASFSLGKNVADNIVVQDKSVHSTFLLTPQFSKFVKTNVLRGIGASYGYSRQKNTAPGNNVVSINSLHTVGVNGFSQKFFPLSKQLFFTVQAVAGASVMLGRNESTGVASTSKNTNRGYALNVNLTPGLSYKLSDRWLFDAFLNNVVNIGFSHNRLRNEQTKQKSVNDNFGLSSSLGNTTIGNIGIGFRYLLPASK